MYLNMYVFVEDHNREFCIKPVPEVTKKRSCGVLFSDLRCVLSGAGAILDDSALDGDFTLKHGGGRHMSVLGLPFWTPFLHREL